MRTPALKRINTSAIDQETVFVSPILDQGIKPRVWKRNIKKIFKFKKIRTICQYTIKSKCKKNSTTIQTKNEQKIRRETHRQTYTDGNKHMKRRSAPLAIREMQIETTAKYHCTPIRLQKWKTVITPSAGENVEIWHEWLIWIW